MLSAKVRFLVCAFCAVLLLNACSSSSSEDKGPRSPCVGGPGSPCEREPVNIWRM